MDEDEFNRLFQNAIEQSQAQLQQKHEEQIKRLPVEADREAKIKVVEERLTRKFDDEVRELNRAFEESRGANPGSPRCFFGGYLAPGLIHLDK